MTKLKKPVLVSLGIYFLCFISRIIEYFVIRTDKSFWGEAFLHKLIGIAIMCVAVKRFSTSLEYIGFAKSKVLKNLAIGLLFGILVFTIGYGAEILISISQGSFQSLSLFVSSYAIEGNMGYNTGIVFLFICIMGNIINVVMEEGVFRGLFQKILQQKYSFIISAIIAALLFGLWHAIGPIRNYYDGISSLDGMKANILMLTITSGLGGFKFALLTKLSGSLYMAMGDHFVNNTIVNILHVISSGGVDELMFLRITIAQTVSFVVVLIFYIWKAKCSTGYNTKRTLKIIE